MRSHTNEGVEGRIFTQFIALIIRNKIYTALQEENEKLEKKQNYMTGPAATLKDLLDKRDALRQKKLLDAIAQSGRSYEEIMQYLHSKSEEV